jgi:single-strand DNA-binding protein
MIQATIIGRLGKDATQGAAGQSKYTSFSLAAQVGYGQNKKTEWVNCTLWGECKVLPFLRKGKQVCVTGKLSLQDYNGKQYMGLKVDGLDLLSDDTKPQNAIQPRPQQAPAMDLSDDGVPF